MRHPLSDLTVRRTWAKLYKKRLNKREERFLRALRRYFKDQEKRILGSLRTVQRGILDESFNISAENEIALGVLVPIIRDIMKSSGEDITELLDYPYPFQFNAALETSLQKRSEFFVNSINQTTFKQLQEVFQQGLDYEKTADEVRALYSDSITQARARTIVRTESQVATQTAQLESYKQAGVGIKIWVWVPGIQGGVRDSHAAIDGEEVPIDQPFSNGLMMPGDPNGSGDEVINCQCTL